jgi:hypothetical protein
MNNTKQPRNDTEPERSTPGRPHDASRQQKHADQNAESGSESLDRHSSRDADKQRPPVPPGPK